MRNTSTIGVCASVRVSPEEGQTEATPVEEAPAELDQDGVRIAIAEDPATGKPDADEDPDHERDENGRERRDVIAEIEHC